MHRRVAIIAYSLRFPGTDTQNFWADLLAKKDLVTEVDPSRWSKDVFLHPDKRHPGTSYTFAAGTLGDVSGFDAAFFGISPREAVLIDPQQRILLELAWEAFENAGKPPSSLRGSDCGVYIGISNIDFFWRLADDLSAIEAAAATGCISSIASNRISYVFDLHGPSLSIDTACSSSLVAFHHACQAISSGEITQALAGGINLHLHPYAFISFSKASMLSKTGRCHVFDESSDGYVRSEGGGLFFLKDYDQALADGDPILAIVAGTAVNTDGHKSGLTIPNVNAQAELMARTYKRAGISPDEIDYFEAHGTGTAVGDPIETQAIGKALGQKRSKPLLIGSVKSNLGHLESASGVAGLVKALNCIQYRAAPATANITKLNPNIKFDEWNLEAITETVPLKAEGNIVIGINSFGFGGANAHVILKSPAENGLDKPKNITTRTIPLILSGRTTAALKQSSSDIANFLDNALDISFYDIAYTAFFRREHHQQSLLIFSDTVTNAAEKLHRFNKAENTEKVNDIYTGYTLSNAKGPAFIYSGNGCQWRGMGRQLLTESETFRQTVFEIDKLFNQYADFSLIAELSATDESDRYDYTEIAQPTLFAIQVGITEIFKEHGITPIAVLGHSVGEVAAAWAAGILTLPEAVQVIFYRSHYQAKTKGSGGMSAVGMGANEILELIDKLNLPLLSLAGVNSHRGVTIAGDVVQLAILETELNAHNTFYKRLPLDYAFHCSAMDSIEVGIRKDLAGIKNTSPKIAFFSTVTGEQIISEELSAEYWWHNIRKPVLFQQAVNALLEQEINVLVEISTHPILHSYLNDSLTLSNNKGLIVNTLTKSNAGIAQLSQSIAKLMLSGAYFNHQHWFPSTGKFIRLPNYAWQKEKLWHPITAESYGLLTRKKNHPLLGYPLQQHPLSWENQLDTQLLPFLADHNIGGAILFPGAGFAELSVAIAHQVYANDFIEIEELEIRNPLVLNEDQTKVTRVSINAINSNFSIQSRDLAQDSEWQMHCVGRILIQSTGQKLDISCPSLPTRQADFDTVSHASLTQKVSLNYGKAFQAIKQGWLNGQHALAILSTPDIVKADIDDYYLHPSFLDCSFQLIFQILKNQLYQQEGIAFVPVHIGRINLRCTKSTPVIAEAFLLHQSPHSLNSKFVLYDANGLAIAVIDNVRFRAVRLHKQKSVPLNYLDYHLTPKPLQQSSLSINNELFSRLATNINQQSILRYCTEVEPLLDGLCHQHFIEFLCSQTKSNFFLSIDSIEELTTNRPEKASFIQMMLDFSIANQSLIVTEQHGWQITQEDLGEKELASTAIWNSLVEDYPDYFYLIELTGRVGLHLNQLINENENLSECDITTALYSKINSFIFEQTSKETLTKALVDQYRLFVESLQFGERIQILEIGAYKPEFVDLVCSELNFNLADYCFASFCEDALTTAKNLQEHYPLLQTLNLTNFSKPTNPTTKANFAIVNLNFTDNNQISRLFDCLPELLAPNCPIILIGLYPAYWIDSILGLMENWWSPVDNKITNDGVLSVSSAQLPPKFIAEQLTALKFSNAQIYDLLPSFHSGHYLITACSPLAEPINESISGTNWLIVTDSEAFSNNLATKIAKQLAIHGQHVVIEKSLIDPNEYDHIIHLAQFGQQNAEQQTERCWLASQAANHLESGKNKTTVWFLTQQVASLWRCDQELITATYNPEVIANDAALWGFGRSLMNESTNYQIRLLDINGDINNDHLLTTIINEFLQNDNEHEVIITASGQRFVPRLRHEPNPVNTLLSNTSISKEEQNLRLCFKFPGQLRYLYWQQFNRTSPTENEIEVEVKATGLNFRDVMYTLGLLSDEAVENGFVGASLGLEFAGIVIRTGSAVSRFKQGDQVVGLGSASFSNRVLTNANSLTLIPNNMSFSAAATIPSTFLTVYYALHHQARLQTGEKILIHGAAGGIGIAAIQVARWLGAEIYATVGSQKKRDFLKLMGIQHIHDSRSLNFAEEILAKTNQKGVDVVLNSLAGEAINRNFMVLKPFGRFLELGKRDFYENTAIGLRPFRNNISYFGIDVDQLMQERPELTEKLFKEMMQLFHDGILHPLPFTTFDANQVIEAFRYMQQAKQIGKIVLTYSHGIHVNNDNNTHTVTEQPSLSLTDQGCYLVTGGLSGFGLKSAQWLVSKGARHLILISRRGQTDLDETKIALSEWQKLGINVYTAACDVTNEVALSALLEKCKTKMPPLKGIIHAAAVFDDHLARNLSENQIHSVLNPKIQGALALHKLTLTIPLDFFVLYSSVTTLFGNPGQANYVAANLWLEAFTIYRKQLGLPATCVRWGAIDDAGFLARNPKIKEALQNRIGGKALSSERAFSVLEAILHYNSPTLGVMEFDWQAISRSLPVASTTKFREVVDFSSAHDHHDENQHSQIKTMLDNLSDEDLQIAFIDILKEELSHILLINKEKIDSDQSMYDMGLDSLMGVELMVAIESRFNAKIPVMALSEAPTLKKLSLRLILELRGGQTNQNTSISDNISELSKRHESALTSEQFSALAKEIESDSHSKMIRH